MMTDGQVFPFNNQTVLVNIAGQRWILTVSVIYSIDLRSKTIDLYSINLE